MSKSFRDLEIYKESFRLYFEIQILSKQLPKHETYELGSQIRRSADSVVTNIVEGYGRRNYKPEFERFLTFSHSSINETVCHLEKINILYPNHYELTSKLIKDYDLLARKVYRFMKFVEDKWLTPKYKPKTHNS